MNLKFFLPLLGVFLLSACAQFPAKKSMSSAIPSEVHPAVQKEKKPPLPQLRLSEQILYEYLVAEVAGQRGHYKLATTGMMDLAQSTRDPRFAERATAMALRGHDKQLALKADKLWLTIDPVSTRALKVIVVLLVETDRLEKVRPYLERFLASDKSHVAQELLRLGGLFRTQRHRAAVVTLVRQVTASYRHLPEAHFAVAQAAYQAGRFKAALVAVRQALKLRPGWRIAALFQGGLLQRVGDKAQAGKFYQSYLRDYPDAKEVRLAYARFLAGERQFDAARRQFTQLQSDYPNNPEVSLTLGLLSVKLNELNAAQSYFEKAVKQGYPDANAIYFNLGQLNAMRQHDDAAARWYLKVGPGEYYLRAQIQYAGVLAKQGQTPKAIAHLQQVRVLATRQRVQLVAVAAQLLRDAGQYQAAYRILDRWLKKLPDNPDLLYDHALAAEKIGQSDTLKRDLHKLIQLKPDFAQAYNALGYTLADHNEHLDEAQRLLDKAQALSPHNPFILDSVGWLYYRKGNGKQAIVFLKRALSIRPDPEIAAHLGEVLWMTGAHRHAAQVWRDALKAHPKNNALLNAIKKFNP